MKIPTKLRLSLMAGVWLCLTLSSSARDCLVYFGTYTNALSQGIYVSRLDTKTGDLTTPELAAETPSPCFLATSPDQKYLYAANSIKKFHDENAGAISAFAIDTKSGHLTFLNQKSSGGDGPCHVSVDHTGKILLAANYGAGSIKSFSLATNGAIATDDTYDHHEGRGVNPARQSSPHAHFITADPGNHFALACDLGLDRVYVYSLDLKNGALKATPDPATTTVPPGSGARHLAFSRNGKFAYVINEMGCSVTTLAWDGKAGTLTPIETISALPETMPLRDTYTAAEILVHPNGGYVYATIRGPDIITVFAANKKTGKLSRIQTLAAGGQMPRGLGIDPTGHWLFTGNQKSNNAAEFAIDPKTGELTPTGRTWPLGSPVDFKFVELK